MKKCVSVIVPIYNSERHLEKCLNSLINQTYDNLDIILIDDGSTDNSSLICDEYAKRDNRLRIIHQKNVGVSKTRNNGLKLVNGDYITFVDSDDYLDLDTFEKCIEIFDKNHVDIIRYNIIEEYNTFSKEQLLPDFEDGIIDKRKLMEFFVDYKITGSASNIIFKKELSNNLLFKEDAYLGEDLLFSLEAFLKANKIYLTRKCFYHYIIHSESAMNNKKLFIRNFFEYVNNFFYTIELFEKYNFLHEDYLNRIACSRFKHILGWHIRKMYNNNMKNEAVECLISPRFKELINNICDRSQLSKYNNLLIKYILSNNKFAIKLLLLTKEFIIKLKKL